MRKIYLLFIFILALGSQGLASPLASVSLVELDLERALSLYRIGDSKNAKEELKFARYHGFKNTGLEAMIKKELSYAHAKEIENHFSRLESMIDSSLSYEALHQESEALLERLYQIAQGLPELEQQGAVKNWHEVVKRIDLALAEALDLYSQNAMKQAISKVQSAYFDIFEESGMEQAILILSEDRKLKAEQRFRSLTDMMKKGESPSRLKNYANEMHQDFSQLAEALTPKELRQNNYSPLPLLERHSLLPWLAITSLLALLSPLFLLFSLRRARRRRD